MTTAIQRAVGLSVASAAAALLVVVGCSEEEPAAPPESDEPAAQAEEAAGDTEQPASEAEAIARAKRAAKKLGGTLKTRLTSALEEGGPASAIEVCADDAQRITDRIREETGVRVGRSSLKLRNPDNGGPRWVHQWLEARGERAAEGVEPMARVEEGEARFVAPIAVEGLCVTCHGPREALPEEVRAVLSERYAEDQAVGYEPGDLRGAIWAAAPLSE